MLEASQAADEGRPSPLAEVDPKSLDIWFERINSKLVQGIPEALTDDDLKPVIEILRAKRQTFLVEQARKSAEAKPKRNVKKNVSVPDLLDELDTL